MRIETDSEGYLKESACWSGAGAGDRGKENITLSPSTGKWCVLCESFTRSSIRLPAIRMLVKAMANKYGEEKGNSRYLYRLFPKGPAKQATKIAGLPKPVKCI
ncbi:sulfurtransferase TusE [Enterobacter sp. EA-1]|nr:sulfurtransferase TusE [Enterobacter sp. EA-1]